MIQELQELIQKLDRGITTLAKNGNLYAQADRDYRVALAQEILLQRNKGTPATIMSDLCRGKPEIADLRLHRDICEANYKANLEAINVWKIQIKVLENQISREWGRNDGGC